MAMATIPRVNQYYNWGYELIGSGFCSDWNYLMEGQYPAFLDATAPDADNDPLLECVNRCVSAANFYEGYSPLAFYVNSENKCACTSTGCNEQTADTNYTSYKIKQNLDE